MGKVLLTQYLFFHKDVVLVLPCLAKCLFKSCAVVNDRNADAGAAGAGLDYAGVADLIFDLGNIAVLSRKIEPFGSSDTGTHKHLLGNVLVHGKQASNVSRARIFDAVVIKGRLKLTVLTHSTVKCQKDHVGGAAELDYTVPDKSISVTALLLQCGKIGNGVLDLVYRLFFSVERCFLVKKLVSDAEINVG